jgi:hypothetical protein
MTGPSGSPAKRTKGPLNGTFGGLAGFILLGATLCLAAGDAEVEITHLLRFIQATPCRFERNGVLYGGAEAAEHLKRKYDHSRGKVQSVETFIGHVASASSLSGRRYRVHCAGEPSVDSADWLRDALQTFRK